MSSPGRGSLTGMSRTTTDSWALMHGERAALAADLADLADLEQERWATPSLCAGLTRAAGPRPPDGAGEPGRPPPDGGCDPLGETVVHGEDIRRPLGIGRDHPTEVVTRVAEYYRGTDQVVLAKGRIGGLRLVATDGPFATGSGPLVSGPTVALVMAMTGRAAFCADLEGDGVATLLGRGYGRSVRKRRPRSWTARAIEGRVITGAARWSITEPWVARSIEPTEPGDG